MGNMIKRKMQRTKREQLQLIENMNRNALDILISQHNRLINEIVMLQKNFLAVVNVFKKQRMIDDFVINRELRLIEEMERLKEKAIIIDPSKGEEKVKEEKSEPGKL